MALLVLLWHVSKMKQLELCVFHVDHNLRNSSSQDLLWVKSLAQNLSIAFFSRSAADEECPAVTKGEGVEAWARQFRYDSFLAMSKESGAEVVATGHTADDQLETVVMRLFSGTSLQGIIGIRPESERLVGENILKLWRPMMKVQRSELEEYLQEEQQDWLLDETNLLDDYLRNSVRHNLIPRLLEIFPRAGEKVSNLVADIEVIQEMLSRQATDYLEENCCGDSLRVVPLPDALKKEVARQWLIRLGFGREITHSFIERIVDLWVKNASNRRLDHRKYCFCREKGYIVFQGKDL